MAEICFVKLNLVLVAVEERKYEGGNIMVNPRNKPITPNIIGLFLTTSSDAAKRAWFYCRVCHENIENIEDLKRCSCKKLAKARFEYFTKGQENRGRFVAPPHNGAVSNRQSKSTEGGLRRRKVTEEKTETGRQDTAKMKYDSTGYFHWCPSKSMGECILTRQEANVTMFAGHVVVAGKMIRVVI